ncbi:MAG TPA: hypothetical protein DF383_08700, partial [Deltaproteobacteria bacterium]|nr:hypothetical protein [Deltaproteobacteria bacterium]
MRSSDIQPRGEATRPFHTFSILETARLFHTDLENGLSPERAAEQLKTFGPNLIRKEKSRGVFSLLLHQILNPMILLLLAVIAISFAIGHFTDALIIALIVVLNTVIGFSQEHRAERAMESIRRLAVPKARVLRGGRPCAVPAQELVPGDVVLLEAGDRIPGDLRLAKSAALRIDESLLTGESVP